MLWGVTVGHGTSGEGCHLVPLSLPCCHGTQEGVLMASALGEGGEQGAGQEVELWYGL